MTFSSYFNVRTLSVRAQPLGHHAGDDDTGQPRAGQRSLASEHFHLQFEDFQGNKKAFGPVL